ncbi:MAG: DUF4956 domain-containing protein [Crocinitomicaceae bacterium]|nr:DUF4956 domain-containing protein [Crocinitomicaceae bacterium]
MPEETSGFLGMDFITDDFYKLLFRFFVNLVFLTILVRLIYYRKTERKDYLFTYYMISTISFMICFALKKLDIDTGMGLGLFAIFGIIRYRTNTVRIKEMTYLFVTIGLSVVNALAGKQISLAELLFINVVTVFVVFLLEYVFLQKHENVKTILYEKIDLIKPDKSEELHADLEARTGLKITKVQVIKVDFLRDTAQVKIFYHSDRAEEIFPDDD